MAILAFDLGNVLPDWDPRLVYRGCFRNGQEVDDFRDGIGLYAWSLTENTGRGGADSVRDPAVRHPRPVDLGALCDRDRQRSISEEIVGSVAILRQLPAAGGPQCAITNFSSEPSTERPERFDVLVSSVREAVDSAHCRLAKPDPAILRRSFDLNRPGARDSNFIGDSAADVAATAGIGIAAIRSGTPDRLRQAPSARGLPA